MDRIIKWLKSGKRYYCVYLFAILALLMMSIGSFEFGASRLGTNIWQTIKFGILTGIVLEVYQSLIFSLYNWRSSLQDILADFIGLLLGVGIYCLFTLATTQAAIMLIVCSFVSCLLAFAMPEHKWKLLGAFLGCMIVGFSLFLYA
jgi:hypothetical protein